MRPEEIAALPPKLFGVPVIIPAKCRHAEIPGDGYIMERKRNGTRCLIYHEPGKYTKLIGQEWKNDYGPSFPEIVKELQKLIKVAFIGDSEFVFVRSGRDMFLTTLSGRGKQKSRGVKPKVVIFDLIGIEYKGKMLNLEKYPIEERKEILEALVPEGAMYFELSRVYDDPGEFERIYEEIVDSGGEGAVFKKLGQRYIRHDGHDSSRSWLKKKREMTADCVVIGMKPGEKRRADTFGALFLGQYNDGALVEVGKVGTGFDDRMLAQISAFQERNDLPMSMKPTPSSKKEWLKAALVVEVRYMERTHENNKLFHPSFLRIRKDKGPRECTIEEEQ